MANGASNVWTQMNYVPPRGQCNHKASILAARCPCLRFMLHPLKVRVKLSSLTIAKRDNEDVADTDL